MQIKHIGLLKPAPGKEANLIAAVEELGKFSESSKNVVSFTHGPYDSHEGLNQGFSYIFEVVFSSKEARDEYLNNETHKTIAGKIIGNLENPEDFKTSVSVVDFEDKFLTIRSLCDFIEQFIPKKDAQIKARDKETFEILGLAREQLINAQKKDNSVFNKTIDLKAIFNTQNESFFNINRENITQARIRNMIQRIDNILNTQQVIKESITTTTTNTPTCNIL